MEIWWIDDPWFRLGSFVLCYGDAAGERGKGRVPVEMENGRYH